MLGGVERLCQDPPWAYTSLSTAVLLGVAVWNDGAKDVTAALGDSAGQGLTAAPARTQAGTEGAADSTSITLLEGQLTWLCHIVAAIIRGPYMNSTGDSQARISHAHDPPPLLQAAVFQSAFSSAAFSAARTMFSSLTLEGCACLQETIDGDLAVRVFGLLPVVDSGYHQGRYGERSRQRLDLAILSLFQSFRKVYIGEQVMHSSKVCAADSAQKYGRSEARYSKPSKPTC